MEHEVKLNRIDTVLATLDYPLTPADVAAECDQVTVRLADGDVELGDIIEQSHSDEFTSVDDLRSEIMTLLPRRAVGEPFQSEGDA